MHLMLATCALLAAYTIGADTAMAALTGDLPWTVRTLQPVLNGGLFLGLAGVLISLSYRPRYALPLLFLGGVSVGAMLIDTMFGVTRGQSGWETDLIEFGKCAGVFYLFGTRFETVARDWRDYPGKAR